LSKFLAPRGP